MGGCADVDGLRNQGGQLGIDGPLNLRYTPGFGLAMLNNEVLYILYSLGNDITDKLPSRRSSAQTITLASILYYRDVG